MPIMVFCPNISIVINDAKKIASIKIETAINFTTAPFI